MVNQKVIDSFTRKKEQQDNLLDKTRNIDIKDLKQFPFSQPTSDAKVKQSSLHSAEMVANRVMHHKPLRSYSGAKHR